MSPLAALVQETSSPLVLLLAVGCEWWAIWFVLGRDFATTLRFTLLSNAASLAAGNVLRLAGALGPAAAAAGAAPVAWIAAWLALLAANSTCEAFVLRQLMRRQRRQWSWNRYDLAVFVAANALTLFLAAAHRRWLA